MDSGWLKAQAEKLAQAAQQRADDLQQRASQLAETTIHNALGTKVGAKEVEFEDWELGFALECVTVVSVEAGAQADRLGVEVGDRLVAVDGYPVPPFEPGTKEETRAKKMIRQWMDEMPRPATLTFQPLAPQPAEAAPALGAGAELDDARRRARERLEEARRRAQQAEDADLGAEAEAATPEDALVASGAFAEADAPDDIFEVGDDEDGASSAAGAAAGALAAAPPGAQAAEPAAAAEAAGRQASPSPSPSPSPSDGVEADRRQCALLQRKVAELQKQVAALRAENKEILLSASSGEADSFEALEAATMREAALREEVSRLREAMQSAAVASAEAAALRSRATEEAEQAQTEAKEVQRSADAKTAVAVAEATASHAKELEALRAQLLEAEARATAAAQRLEATERELQGLGQAHEAEIELQLEERRAREGQLQRQLESLERQGAAAERQAASELEAARAEVEEARRQTDQQRVRAEAAAADAQAAATEAAAARLEAAAAAAALAEAGAAAEDLVEEPDDGLEQAPRATAGGDAEALRMQIAALERRCVLLQKKLHARPAVARTASDAGPSQPERPAWAQRVAAVAGPAAAELAVLGYLAADGAMRSFTRQLLRRGIVMWLFYTHLLVLYTVSMSALSQATSGADGDPVDTINVLIKDGRAHAGAGTGAPVEPPGG